MKKTLAVFAALTFYFGSAMGVELNPANGCGQGAHVKDHSKQGKICVQDQGSWGDTKLSDTPICPEGYMCQPVLPETIVDADKGTSLVRKAPLLNVGQHVKDKNGCLYLITDEANKLAIKAVFERMHDRVGRQLCKKYWASGFSGGRTGLAA